MWNRGVGMVRRRGKMILLAAALAAAAGTAMGAPTPVEMPAITDFIDLDSVVDSVTTYAGGAVVKLVPFLIAVIIFWKFIFRMIRPT